jgi:hypothetical protein
MRLRAGLVRDYWRFSAMLARAEPQRLKNAVRWPRSKPHRHERLVVRFAASDCRPAPANVGLQLYEDLS